MIKTYELFLESIESKLDEQALKKIKIAVINIINKYPFFSGILFNLTVAESNKIPTMATDGISILYNPQFTNSLSLNEVIFVLCHECMHNSLLHFNRIGNRNGRVYNEAADYAINLLLDDIGERPNGVLYDKRYLNLSTEEIYAMLIENFKQKNKNKQQCPKCGGKGGSGEKDEGQEQDEDGQGEGQEGQGEGMEKGGGNKKDKCPVCGKEKGAGGGEGEPTDMDGEDFDGGIMSGDIKKPGTIKPQPDKIVYEGNKNLQDNANNENELNKQWKDIVNNAANRQQGAHMSDSLRRFVENINKPEINWKVELKRFIQIAYNKIKKYSIPNRRYVHSGIYVPGVRKESEEFDNAVIIIDTSDSIQQDELDKFATELNELYNESKTSFQINTSYVIWCDSDIRKIQEFDKRNKFDIKKLKPQGGGGTSFVPPFMWINEKLIKRGKKPCFVIYFTDTAGDAPNRNLVSYADKVLWLIIGGAKGDHIQFGKKINMDGRLK